MGRREQLEILPGQDGSAEEDKTAAPKIRMSEDTPSVQIQDKIKYLGVIFAAKLGVILQQNELYGTRQISKE